MTRAAVFKYEGTQLDLDVAPADTLLTITCRALQLPLEPYTKDMSELQHICAENPHKHIQRRRVYKDQCRNFYVTKTFDLKSTVISTTCYSNNERLIIISWWNINPYNEGVISIRILQTRYINCNSNQFRYKLFQFKGYKS